MSEPQTEAGRAVVFTFEGRPSGLVHRDDILAIEQEARAALRAELAAKVEALPRGRISGGQMYEDSTGRFLDRAAVLDLIRGDSPE